MKIAVMARPYTAATIQPHILDAYPDADITYVGGGCVSPLSFRLPRGLPLSAYPWTGEPAWRRNPDYSTVYRMVPDAETGRRPQHVETSLSPIDTFSEADLHILADDTTMGQFANFADLVAHSGRSDSLHRALWSDIAFRHGETLTTDQVLLPFDDEAVAKVASGRTKRRFDHAWAVNSVVVIGMTMRMVTGRKDATPPSKYGMQLLYRMRNEPPRRIGPLLQLMTNWEGTGRYSGTSSNTDGLGNGASRCRMLTDLSAAGLITPVTFDHRADHRREISLTEDGHAFLDALHPDCRDPDLPFRIWNWMQQGEKAHTAIDRYIRTYFGKQLRFVKRAS
jgi:hypothetical protein